MTEQRRRGHGRRAVAWVVACAIAAASACGGGDPEATQTIGAEPTDPTETGTGSAGSGIPPAAMPGEGMVPGDPDALENAGVQVVAGVTEVTTFDAPLVLVREQADRLLADVGAESGLLGSTIDEFAPLPPDVPAMSYLLAAWVSTADTVAAETARTWMGDQDWTRAPDLRFPDAVVALFVNDIASAVDAAAPADDGSVQIDLAAATAPGPSGTTNGSGSAQGIVTQRDGAPAVGAGQLAQAGPCSAVQTFIAGSLAAVVNALHINPVTNGGLLGDITNVFVDVFNAAIELAAGGVQTLIDELTAPVFDLIRVGIASLGVATQFASFFRDTRLTVVVQPRGATRFAIGSEADISGQFVARTDALIGKWPAELVDCARATGVALPQPIGAGAEATWSVRQAPPVVTPRSTTSTVESDLLTRLDFVTGRESEEQAKGPPTNSAAYADVRIPRKDVEDLLRLGRSQAATARSSLLGRIPIPLLRDAADAALALVLDPVLARVDSEISGAANGMFSLSGVGLVFVEFHLPPDPTTTVAPTTPPTDEPGADFCDQFRELIVFSESSDLPVVPWALEIVDRLEEMRPAAPADLVASVDVLIRVYAAVAAEADILVLLDTTEPLPAASAAIGAHCGIQQSE